MEQEVLQVAQHVARLTVNHHFLLAFRQVIHHRFIRIQLRAVLVEVGHFQLGTDVNRPLSACSWPSISFSSVVFPQPFGPIRAILSPRWIWRRNLSPALCHQPDS
jgi:hypothetical protein